ncbi:hypothetical protein PHISCL_00525 [Aspergillus sclerotialis]|uniref:Uncharacterized protein n=1 Tax=Aspergillus sclerotialis TaxID=2070753 RepID=A0A3A2ZVM7_9EURO|nr:hypothetical protein PHISCL_00525 [Aspergillus sclerotialis]
MSLKRKASYPAITPSNGRALATGLDDTPRHLNSRTRKRFRNDRPSDEVVYENTLRWLFSAQQQQQQQQDSVHSHDEDMMNLESFPPPNTVDPRQHTLLKFFKPSRPSSTRPPPNTGMWKGDALSRDPIQHHALEMKSPTSSIATGTNSPSSQRTDIDMEMDSGSDESAQDSKRWVGGLGWM